MLLAKPPFLDDDEQVREAVLVFALVGCTDDEDIHLRQAPLFADILTTGTSVELLLNATDLPTGCDETTIRMPKVGECLDDDDQGTCYTVFADRRSTSCLSEVDVLQADGSVQLIPTAPGGFGAGMLDDARVMFRGCDEDDASVPLGPTHPGDTVVIASGDDSGVDVSWLPTAPYAYVEVIYGIGQFRCLTTETSLHVPNRYPGWEFMSVNVAMLAAPVVHPLPSGEARVWRGSNRVSRYIKHCPAMDLGCAGLDRRL